jgi:hypothetical protein
MKSIGIQIKSNEAILVVLERNVDGVVSQLRESTKIKLDDPLNQDHVQQFRDQINATLDIIQAYSLGIIKRSANLKSYSLASPISFKLEGIIQLYDKINVEIISDKTYKTFFKKNEKNLEPNLKYQSEAFDLAYYLLLRND